MTGFRFDRFHLDPDDRQLRREGAVIELNARYLDALTLLVGEQGRLVSKDRFLEEVWRGIPVTDEALTQCIKTLRRQLGDDAASPRFIETVPKHGYRFIAPVERGTRRELAAATTAATFGRSEFFRTGGAGTIGGAAAGAIGGIIYGVAGASQPMQPGSGGLSVLLVLLWLTTAAAVMGGAGVSFGIAAAGYADKPHWRILGGALGGMIVGGFAKLLGLDAFNLLLGRSPADITGAVEGFLLGGAVGAGAWLASRHGWSFRRRVTLAGAIGIVSGIVIALIGRRLMGGSLDLLARTFPDSRLRIDAIGGLFGEPGYGTISRIATSGLEGGLFAACVVGAIMLAGRRTAGILG